MGPAEFTDWKMADCAEARASECGIVRPIGQTIGVVQLTGMDSVAHGRVRLGMVVTSALLGGLASAVDAVFDARWSVV